MHDEYKQIVDNGLLVQLDDARAAVTYDRMVPPGTLQDYRKWVARHDGVTNRAIEDIPREKIRYHVCWGAGPVRTPPTCRCSDIIDLILSVRAGAFVLEMANPRHEHEWQVWEDVKLPKGAVLIPGVISHASNVVEHPELIQRAHRAARQAGRTRERHCRHRLRLRAAAVLSVAFIRRIQWAKLQALVEGARLASKELWGKKKAAKKKAPAKGKRSSQRQFSEAASARLDPSRVRAAWLAGFFRERLLQPLHHHAGDFVAVLFQHHHVAVAADADILEPHES